MARFPGQKSMRIFAGITGALLASAANADLPTISPTQTFPAPPLASPAHFAPYISTDGHLTLVTVDSGPAAYLYRKDKNGLWRYDTALEPPSGKAAFGGAVRGNVAVVQGADTSGAAAAIVFRRSGDVWTVTQSLPMPEETLSDPYQFIAITASTLAVGEVIINDGAGQVQIYDKVGAGTYVLNATLAPAGAGEGFIVGINPGLEHNTLIEVSPSHGEFYYFQRTGGVWSQKQTFSPSIGYQNFRFALDDDNMVASSPSGTAVFARKGGTWIQQQVLINPDTGQPITALPAIHGRRIVLADSTSDRVLVFESNNGSWTATAQLSGTDPVACSGGDGDFADGTDVSIALSNTEAFIGCPFAPTQEAFTGVVRVYNLQK
jgi:hypothetical protein